MREIAVKAVFGSAERPLLIGPDEGAISLPCFVLEDGRRVLSQRGMLSAIGLSTGGSRVTGESRLVSFVDNSYLEDLVENRVRQAIENPIYFELANGNFAYGFEAFVLVELCRAVLAARDLGRLTRNQESIARQCDLLIREFAKIGLVALIDEHTGYQQYRRRFELQEIINHYIAEDLRAWTKTFPDEFYQQIFRLKGWFGNWRSQRPGVVGHWTNEFVYGRLAPGVLDELKELEPRSGAGYRINRFHQWLTNDVGHPALKEHLEKIIVLMRVSQDWEHFVENIQKAIPKPNEQWLIPYSESAISKARSARRSDPLFDEIQDI